MEEYNYDMSLITSNNFIIQLVSYPSSPKNLPRKSSLHRQLSLDQLI